MELKKLKLTRVDTGQTTEMEVSVLSVAEAQEQVDRMVGAGRIRVEEESVSRESGPRGY
jgi:hypothetical protein